MQSYIRKPLVLLASVIFLLGATIPPTTPAFDPQHPPASDQSTAPPFALSEQTFVPDELLIRFKPSAAAPRVDRLLAERGVTRARRVSVLDIHVLRLPPGLSVEQAVEVFSHLPEVEFVEPNYIVHIADVVDPGLDGNQWAPQNMDAPQGWSNTEGDPAVVIAVVDTGVDYRHTELSPNIWTHGEIPGNGVDDDGNGYVDDAYGWDFVNNDGDPLDDHLHGTHVAGIAAAVASDNP